MYAPEPSDTLRKDDGTMPERAIKILMIDDDEQILFALGAVFQFQGWASVSARDVPTGLELFQKESPDLFRS